VWVEGFEREDELVLGVVAEGVVAAWTCGVKDGTLGSLFEEVEVDKSRTMRGRPFSRALGLSCRGAGLPASSRRDDREVGG
jgi:hypothetical protein